MFKYIVRLGLPFFWVRTHVRALRLKNWLKQGNVSAISRMLLGLSTHDLKSVLSFLGARLGPDSYVESHLFVHNANFGFNHLQVGGRAYIGEDCFFDLSDAVTIEGGSTLAARVTILTHFDAGFAYVGEIIGTRTAPVTVKERAYVGVGAIILPGVTIGAGAVVAAGAVVTKDVEDRTVVGGVPASFLKQLG